VNMLLESQSDATPRVISSESVVPYGPVCVSAKTGEGQPLDAPAIDADAFDELGLA
jgi:hypothetical protein